MNLFDPCTVAGAKNACIDPRETARVSPSQVEDRVKQWRCQYSQAKDLIPLQHL